MRGQAHIPGLLAVICMRRAICLRSDRGYPNKRLGACDFLPPASFFTFFFSGTSLSTINRRSTRFRKDKNKAKYNSYSNSIVSVMFCPPPLVSVEHGETDDKHEV